MSGAPGVPAATEDGTSAAEAFVRVFAEGWGHPGGADSFVTRFLPVLDQEVRMVQPLMPVLVGVERVAYFDPTPLLRALLTRPRAWPGFARMQLGRLRRRAGRGRGR